MNLGCVDLHKEYAKQKTHRYRRCFNQWQDGKSGRHNAFRLLLCWNLLEISLSSRLRNTFFEQPVNLTPNPELIDPMIIGKDIDVVIASSVALCANVGETLNTDYITVVSQR